MQNPCPEWWDYTCRIPLLRSKSALPGSKSALPSDTTAFKIHQVRSIASYPGPHTTVFPTSVLAAVAEIASLSSWIHF